MDTASLHRRIERLINTDSAVFASAILNSGFACMRCGWCCRENFNIRITQDVSRPSNAISLFPDDIRRIVRGTGMEWDEIAEPDIYSCIVDGSDVWAIGWILRRNDAKECVFYRNRTCTIYGLRPMICRCYPFFMDGNCCIETMCCKGVQNEITESTAVEMGKLLKRYEIKKLRFYINIITQMGSLLKLSNLRSLPRNYQGTVLVCDGEAISRRSLANYTF